MNIGLYQSAAAMSALERWQDVVAQNVTSGQVTGYRKRTVEFSTQSAGEWQLDDGSQTGETTSVPALFPKATNGISFAAGEPTPTGRDLDLAIQGKGFFALQQADGTTAYTRSGEFSLRADHTLVNTANQPVLSDSGSPIVLQGDGSKITVNPDGAIMQGATILARIGVQSFGNPSALVPIAGGTFIANPGADPQPVAKPGLLQGYLESSNTAPMREMVNLVLISRAYDANQRVITNGDQQTQKTIDALG
jgi:flagellar basal body rod protein FlgG